MGAVKKKWVVWKKKKEEKKKKKSDYPYTAITQIGGKKRFVGLGFKGIRRRD